MPEELEVVQFLEGSVAPVECVNHPEICPRSNLCVTRDIWDELKKAMNGILETTTLQDLVELQRQKEQAKEARAHKTAKPD